MNGAEHASGGRRPFSRVALAAFALAVAVVLLAMLSGLGARWGWWDFRTGFTLLRWSAYGGIAVGALALVALFRTRPGGPRRGLLLTAGALAVALAVVLVPWQWRQTARSVPPIHDISTDTESPPAFVAVAPLRADAPNPVEYAGPEVAAQQREAYPHLQPLFLDLPPDQAFQRARDAAEAMGWQMVDSDPSTGRIEATDRTFWYGFYDDVVIRVSPTEQGGSRVDVRSKSRVGGSDVGTNARRIRAYLDRLGST